MWADIDVEFMETSTAYGLGMSGAGTVVLWVLIFLAAGFSIKLYRRK